MVLGCTHYPLLTGVISYVLGDGVTLVSSAEETAKDVYRVLADRGLLRPDHLPEPGHGFTTTGDPEEFRRLAGRFCDSWARPYDYFEIDVTITGEVSQGQVRSVNDARWAQCTVRKVQPR